MERATGQGVPWMSRLCSHFSRRYRFKQPFSSLALGQTLKSTRPVWIWFTNAPGSDELPATGAN